MSNYTKIRINKLLLTLLLLSLLGGFSKTDRIVALTPADASSILFQAQPAQSETCDELQIIFIVDQSGSMFGFTDQQGVERPPTDPLGLRYFAPKEAANRLSAFRYLLYQEATIQFATIYFGDRPQTAIPWQQITPNTEDDHNQLQQDLEPFFAPLERSLGNTLFLAPFQSASSLFTQVTPVVDGCPTRAIIMITDGRPADGRPGFDWQNHLVEVAEYSRQYMPEPEHLIYAIGVDDAGDYWDDTEPYWIDIAGDADRVFRADSQTEMSALVMQIIRELAQTLGEGTFTGCADSQGLLIVPPYMRELIITLNKWGDLTDHLEVEDARGRLIDPTTSYPDVTLRGINDPIETLTVRNPQPGVWRILTPIPAEFQDRCVVSFDAIVADKKLIEPVSGERLTQFQTSTIHFQLVDSAGDPLPDYNDPAYDLQMDVILQTAAGERLLTSGANPGKEYLNEQFVPLEAGAHTLRVDATARGDDGNLYPILPDQQLSTFEVASVRFELLEGPSVGAVVEQYVEIPLTFATTVDSVQPIQIDLPLSITATVTHEESGEQTNLLLSALGDGAYETTFPPTRAGKYILAYEASVNTPQGRQTIDSQEATWDVFPVQQIRVAFTSPDKMVATDPFLRPTGIDVQVQLVDEQGSPVSPSAIGLSDPNAVLDVTVRDPAGEEIPGMGLIQTGTPGLFRLQNNELGIGQHTVIVEPISTPARGFIWEETSWGTQVTGQINPLFYTYLALAILTLVAILLWAIYQMQIRRHPFAGVIEIYAKRADPDGEFAERKEMLDKFYLPPNRNRATWRPQIDERKPESKIIKSIKITSPSEQMSADGYVKVSIKHRDGSKSEEVTLSPGVPQRPHPSYSIIKDPKSSTAGGEAEELPDSFD